MFLLGLILGIAGTIAFGKLYAFWQKQDAEIEAQISDMLNQPAPVIRVCDVKIYRPNQMVIEYSEATKITCDKHDCIVHTREGDWHCVRGWDRVETTPWREYVEENLEDLASALVGDVSVPVAPAEPTDPEVDAMLAAPIIAPPVIPPEDPLAKALVELEDGVHV
jgi:hypothetical protein